jgi:hypothetical protein
LSAGIVTLSIADWQLPIADLKNNCWFLQIGNRQLPIGNTELLD